MKNVPRRDVDALYRAVLSLGNLDEAKAFFRDLLTEAEIREMAERWKVARMIDAKVPYTRIIAETGLSSTTIARVSRWVQRGTGGYRRILRRKDIRP